jgi:hypothetical protein
MTIIAFCCCCCIEEEATALSLTFGGEKPSDDALYNELYAEPGEMGSSANLLDRKGDASFFFLTGRGSSFLGEGGKHSNRNTPPSSQDPSC